MTKIHSKAFLDWLERFGIIPGNCRRVVIDASIDGPVMIYTETFGTKGMIEVEPPPELRTAIKVTTEDTNIKVDSTINWSEEDTKNFYRSLINLKTNKPVYTLKTEPADWTDLNTLEEFLFDVEEPGDINQVSEQYKHKWERPDDW